MRCRARKKSLRSAYSISLEAPISTLRIRKRKYAPTSATPMSSSAYRNSFARDRPATRSSTTCLRIQGERRETAVVTSTARRPRTTARRFWLMYGSNLPAAVAMNGQYISRFSVLFWLAFSQQARADSSLPSCFKTDGFDYVQTHHFVCTRVGG